MKTSDGDGWTIEYTAPHSTDVEYGSEPHYVPIDDLRSWAKRKLGKPDKEAERIAWAVRNKIAKDGTEARYFLERAKNTILNDEGIL